MRLSNEEYFSREELNFSTIKEALKSPKHFWEARETEKEPTASMKLGTAIHCAVLEPLRFNEEFVLEPSIDKRTKEYKEWKELNSSKTPYSEDVKELVDYLNQETSSECLNLIRDGRTINEESFVFEKNFLKMKCKADAYCEEKKMLIDLKTSNDVSPQEFTRTIFNRNYHLQMAHYMLGLESEGYEVDVVRLVAISTTHPYDVVEYELSRDTLDRAKEELFKLYEEVARIISFGDRSGFSEKPIIVEYPKWKQI